jgi:hypothetical protein
MHAATTDLARRCLARRKAQHEGRYDQSNNHEKRQHIPLRRCPICWPGFSQQTRKLRAPPSCNQMKNEIIAAKRGRLVARISQLKFLLELSRCIPFLKISGFVSLRRACELLISSERGEQRRQRLAAGAMGGRGKLAVRLQNAWRPSPSGSRDARAVKSWEWSDHDLSSSAGCNLRSRYSNGSNITFPLRRPSASSWSYASALVAG